jgi:hypothetical protein
MQQSLPDHESSNEKRRLDMRNRPNSVIKLAGAKSVCTGAESVGTEFKSLGTVPVRVLPPIVPAPTAQSRAAGWLNQRWKGRRTGYAPDLFDRIQRVFNQRE